MLILLWVVFPFAVWSACMDLYSPSGGALVDSKGALVGITTFLLKDAQNLNFAIAAEDYWH